MYQVLVTIQDYRIIETNLTFYISAPINRALITFLRSSIYVKPKFYSHSLGPMERNSKKTMKSTSMHSSRTRTAHFSVQDVSI